MKLHVVAVCVLLAMAVSAMAAQPITQAAAKRLAEDTLLTLDIIDKLVVGQEAMRIDSFVWNGIFDRSIEKAATMWHPYLPLQKDSLLEPYIMCSEAVTALRLAKFNRLQGAKEPKNTLFKREEIKWRDDYFRDKKPRCEESIKTGKFPERRLRQ